MDCISIGMTFKNRAKLLDACLNHLQYQDYDLKKIEICIADGCSTDNILEVINKWYPKFHQIKYIKVDKNELPYKQHIYNATVLDYFAEVNIAVELSTHEKFIWTNPEILFIEKDELKYINKELDNNSRTLLWHACYLMKENYKYLYNEDLGNFTKGMGDYNYKKGTYPKVGNHKGVFGGYAYCLNIDGWCYGFNKLFFVEIEGFGNHGNGFGDKWKNYIGDAKKAKYDVMHLYHPVRQIEDVPAEEMFPARPEIDWPFKNPYWHHLEMIKDIKLFKSKD